MRNAKIVLLSVAALAAGGLFGCGSTRSKRSKEPPPEATTSISMASSASINGTLESYDLGAVRTGAHQIGANAALRPADPWYGTFGLKSGVVGDYEFGLGVYVPRPASTVQMGDTTVERAREMGVGVWVMIEF